MSAPALESFAANLYYGAAPLAGHDVEHDYALAKLIGALGVMFQAVEDLARDTPEGPGWSSVMDLERCPPEWLPWLGQFVGVTVVPGSTPAEQRERIARTDGFHRGTPEALRAAAQATLTGSRTVYFRERDGGDAYALQVVTRTAETPDADATLAALVAQKPGGIVLNYSTVATWDYEEMTADGGTYTAQAAAYSDYWNLTMNEATP